MSKRERMELEKEKALNFISTQSTNLIAGGNKIQDSTINIINNFTNVKVKDIKLI